MTDEKNGRVSDHGDRISDLEKWTRDHASAGERRHGETLVAISELPGKIGIQIDKAICVHVESCMRVWRMRIVILVLVLGSLFTAGSNAGPIVKQVRILFGM